MSPITEHTRAMRETYDPQPVGPQHRQPVLRETRPGELLPVTPDPAEGIDWTREARIAIALVAACLVLVLLVHAYASSGAPR